MLGAVLLLAVQVARPDTLLVRAEVLLAAGDLAAARRVAEWLDRARPDDPRILTLLGRIHLAWPTVGRFKAESLLTRAAALDTANPEPCYYLGLVGIALRGDDGEMIARRGLTRVLELEPLYRDAWALWRGLYRGAAELRRGAAALSRHAGEAAPDIWRSQLLIELEDYSQAEPILTSLIARDPEDPLARALLAQLLYESGRDAEAEPAYSAAIARVAADTGSYLWRQVRSIASPDERAAWERTDPVGRASFLRRFWAYRRPDLGTRLNERIGEHFRRVRVARYRYSLLHPNSLYHHSRRWREWGNIFGGPGGPGRDEVAREVRAEPPPDVPASLAGTAGYAPPDDGDRTWNLEDNLDDRGRIYVRYGPPDDMRAWNLDAETWRYRVSGGELQVTFARRTGAYDLSGDPVVTPFVRGEAFSAFYLLATDRTAAPATLGFSFRPVPFRGGSPWQTELLLLADSVRATAALFDEDGREVTRDSATNGPLRLTAPPGRYLLALDVERGGQTGRYRDTVPLPPFTGEVLALSGMLLSARRVPADRGEMARAAPARLRVPAAAPLRFYAELYGLAAAAGVSRYAASYVFERLNRRGEPLGRDGSGRTVIGFRREGPARRVMVESLVIDPGRFQPGRYRLRLEVRDAIAGSRVVSTTIDFELL